MRARLSTIIASSIGVILILIIFGYKRLYDLARAPSVAKPCLFTFWSITDKPTTLAMPAPAWLHQPGGFVNDASCLNRTPVYGIVTARSETDITEALRFARDNNIPLTPAGQRHSMGGQSFHRNGLVLDMRSFNKIVVDKENKVARVESGATWAELQQVIDPLGLSVKAMQSINIFTVGGTLSVNAHGIAHNPGPVASTVRSVRVLLPDGTVVRASPTERADLFKHVLGGYGLFGIILEAELDLTDNALYDWRTAYVPYTEFPKYFEDHIKDDPLVGLFFARLSMSPFSYLKETAVHTFEHATSTAATPPLQPTESSWIQRLVFNLSKTGSAGRWLRATLEKYVAKKLAPCVVARNQALIDPQECLIARNQAMYDAMPYLKNQLPDTDILQEYFVPPEKFVSFVDGLRTIVRTNEANLLNVTIRYVHQDTVTALPYAKEDMFALVLYFNQRFTPEESERLQVTTRELIDLVNEHHGTYYLPYQLHYSPEQLRAAYPEIDSFYTAKKKYDPTNVLTNTWYERYKG